MSTSPPIAESLLMAYADGQLPPDQREALEQRLRADPVLAAEVNARVAAWQHQRELLARAFEPELAEPVPDRLMAALALPARPSTAATSAAAGDAGLPGFKPLEARAGRVEPTARAAANAPRWRLPAALAAGLLGGWVLARVMQPQPDAEVLAVASGQVVAGATLQTALNERLASDADGLVRIQLSFQDPKGRYCRTFSWSSTAGLACRGSDSWVVEQVVPTTPAAAGTMRQASSIPASLMVTVERLMDGSALDADAERAARDRGWSR